MNTPSQPRELYGNDCDDKRKALVIHSFKVDYEYFCCEDLNSRQKAIVSSDSRKLDSTVVITFHGSYSKLLEGYSGEFK
jgi:hypothetical protein